MADASNKTTGNVPGAFYVDDSCISCSLCVSTAPAVFEMNSDDKAFVVKQPGGPEEEAQAREALDACPVNAIGTDG